MIRLHQLHKQFREPLLRGIDLHVSRGEIWGLTGPGASGKSVMLKLIAGLLRPDLGRVEIQGQDITTMDEPELMGVRSKIGMLFQNNALFDFMTVIENVAFPLIRGGASREEAQSLAANRLVNVGLGGSEKKFPSELSGGMKKRVGIARASVTNPAIVIYDEPTAGLDPVTTKKIYSLLKADHDATGSTVIVVSSDVDGLRQFTDRMGLLVQGKLLYNGPTENIETSEDPVVRQFVRGEIEGPL